MYGPQNLLIVFGLALLAVVLGSLIDSFGWSSFFCLAIWSAMQIRELRLLEVWSRRPLSRPDNYLLNWQLISNRLFRSLQRSRSRTHSALDSLQATRAVTESLPDAAIVINANGEIEDLNTGADILLNLRRQDRGHSIASLVRQPDFIALSRGAIHDDLIEFASPLKESIRLEARRIALTDSRSLILVRDVTELNRLLSMRQDFIANVSHELRTPLTVIVGYLETIRNEQLDSRTTIELIDKMRSPTTRMRALVDDLLLLTRLESSPNPSEQELNLIDVRSLINTIANDAKVLGSDKHSITCEVTSEARVIGIEHELLSAFLNLVTNAVRYSPDGGAVNIRWEDVNGGARFSVTDEGIGIPPEHLSRITERFYRVDLAKSRVRGGTGLGLAIVKHVLKRHNSELKISSQLSRGSTFYCDIPDSQLDQNPKTLKEKNT